MPQEDTFTDSLKIVDGHFVRPLPHYQRMLATLATSNSRGKHLPFPEDSLIPESYRQGIVKCRYLYSPLDCQITFEHYTPRRVKSLKLVECNHIDYHLKYADRTMLNALRETRGGCDDILIVQNGQITDTSYSNIVFFDGTDYITPKTYLLNGLQRQYLLQTGRIREKTVTAKDLKYFQSACLINAMLSIEDNIRIDTKDII